MEIRQLRKSFGGAEVLKGVDLVFRRGEVHAFIGANGAGKSTLLGCLSGAVEPTSGTIRIGDEVFDTLSPRLALEKGIGIIYQHFQVVEGLTVADNIFLGSEICRRGLVDTRLQNKRAAALLDRLGVSLAPDMPLDRLSVGERQIVEIARALHIGPRVLILDEPTAALSDREISALHGIVRTLAHTEDIAIVYVTHLIDEISAIADRVTVLRDGAVVWTRPVAEVDARAIAGAIAPNSKGLGRAAPVNRDARSLVRLRNYASSYTGPVDLDIRAGEVVGVYGLMGSGRTDLLESLVGARPRRAGEVWLDGKVAAIRSPSEAMREGIAFVASDRNEQSIFGSLPAIENLLMPHLRGLANRRAKHAALFDRAAADLRLHPRSPDLEGRRFSGGNAQKLVMGRWLLPGLNVRLLVLDEPTQGVDIGARAEIYRLLQDFARAGGAVLVASSDPTEIKALANRVLVLGQGRLIQLIDGEINEDELVHLAHNSFAAHRGMSDGNFSTESLHVHAD